MIPYREKSRRRVYLVNNSGETWMTATEIAQAAGITEQAVYARLHRPGMTPSMLIEKARKSSPPVQDQENRTAKKRRFIDHPLNRMLLIPFAKDQPIDRHEMAGRDAL